MCISVYQFGESGQWVAYLTQFHELSYTYCSMCIHYMAITTSLTVSTMRLHPVSWLFFSLFESFFFTFQSPIIILFAITSWCQNLSLTWISWVDFKIVDAGRKWIRSLDWILTISWMITWCFVEGLMLLHWRHNLYFFFLNLMYGSMSPTHLFMKSF